MPNHDHNLEALIKATVIIEQTDEDDNELEPVEFKLGSLDFRDNLVNVLRYSDDFEDLQHHLSEEVEGVTGHCIVSYGFNASDFQF